MCPIRFYWYIIRKETYDSACWIFFNTRRTKLVVYLNGAMFYVFQRWLLSSEALIWPSKSLARQSQSQVLSLRVAPANVDKLGWIQRHSARAAAYPPVASYATYDPEIRIRRRRAHRTRLLSTAVVDSHRYPGAGTGTFWIRYR
eukprot:SAG31_NODE_3343_length_4381_cov_12.838393_6_plen_144_part_00